MKKLKICVYAISENEEKFVERWVNSTKEADEIYVLDTGSTGPAGILNYVDFYALMPGDNTATVAPGTPVEFPQDGPSSGTTITRINNNSFNLADIVTYQIQFQVSVTEAAQLQLLHWLEELNQFQLI